MISKMATHKVIVMLVISLAFSLIISGCSLSIGNKGNNLGSTTTPKIGDGGFLSKEICGPPCFLGMIPGVTTKNDAIKILQSRGLYQGCEEFDNSKESGVHAIGCEYLIVFLQNNVDIISGVGFQPSQQITVDEVIAKYGEPNFVSMATVAPSNRESTASMVLYYDNINTILGLAAQNSGEYQISPTTQVVTIEFHDNDEYKFQQRYAHSWHGYGVYREHP